MQVPLAAAANAGQRSRAAESRGLTDYNVLENFGGLVLIAEGRRHRGNSGFSGAALTGPRPAAAGGASRASSPSHSQPKCGRPRLSMPRLQYQRSVSAGPTPITSDEFTRSLSLSLSLSLSVGRRKLGTRPT
jgi:hypothetical protein